MADTEEPCRNCGEDAPPIFDSQNGDLICPHCGAIVQGRVIDESAEWRSFADDSEKDKEAKNRAGNKINPFLQNGGMGCGSINNGALERINRMVQGQENRLLRAVFERLRQIQEDLNFSQTALYAAFELCNTLDQIKQLRNRNQDLGALIYLACRQEEEGRSFKEIAAAMSVNGSMTSNDIGRAYLRLEKLLPRAVQRAMKKEVLPETFLPRFCNKLGLPVEVERVSREVCTAPSIVNAQGNRQQAAIALACLFLVSWLSAIDLPISRVAAIAKIGESSLIDCINNIRPLITDVLPSNFRRLRNIKDLPRMR